MSVYFVNGATGSDSNAGTSPGTAWATVGKALLSGSPVVADDTVYVSPAGSPYRQTLAFAVGGSSGSPITLIGDVDGAQMGVAGDVWLSAYTTNDTTNPSTTVLLNPNAHSYVTFQKFCFMGANANPGVLNIPTTSVGIVLQDFVAIMPIASKNPITVTCPADVNSGHVFDRFVIHGGGNAPGILMTLTKSAIGDYNAGFLIQNGLLESCAGQAGVQVSSSGSATFLGGGGQILGVTISGATQGVLCSGGIASSMGSQLVVSGCLIICQTGLSASTSGQILEDHNALLALTPRTNVTAGTGSVVAPAYAPLLEYGQSFITRRNPRPWLEPAAGSPLLGFGTGSGPAVDFRNRQRPSGGGTTFAAGYLERHDTAVINTSVKDGSNNSWNIVGPGDHDFTIPVGNTAKTISVKLRYDSNYVGSLPQVILANGGQIGVSDQTITATTSALNAWETETFSAFTPAAAGEITLRLVNRSTAATGNVYLATPAGI